MEISILNEYFRQYGALVIFVIVFLEYMNFPGFPAGVIMPLAGIWASGGGISFAATLIISIFGGICGSWVLYFIGRYGGQPLLKWYIRHVPKHEAKIEQIMTNIRKKGCKGVFFTKLIPMVRTLIGIPAGVAKMDFIGYTIYSTFGIAIWNLGFIGAGYLFGEQVFQWLT